MPFVIDSIINVEETNDFRIIEANAIARVKKKQ